jgi:hypothetical protein
VTAFLPGLSVECLVGYSALFCVGIVFILLKLPCNNQPSIIPTDKIRDINNALDIDSVQNKNVSSTDVTFWIMNNPAMPAVTMPSISL